MLAGVAAASTAAQYRKQASAICSATNVALSKVVKPTTEAGIGPFLKRDLVIFHRQLRKLVKLAPPKNLKALHTKAVSLETRELAAIQQLVDKIDTGTKPETAYKSLSKKLNSLADAESAAWKKLKVTPCSLQ